MPVDDVTHLTKLLEEHEKLQNTQQIALDRALVLAKEEAERQYRTLNGLKAEYLPRSEYQAAHALLIEKFEVQKERLSETRGWFKVWGAVITALAFAFQLVAHFIWK